MNNLIIFQMIMYYNINNIQSLSKYKSKGNDKIFKKLLSKISNIKGNHRDKFASNGLDSFVDNYHKNNENLLTNLGQYV